MNQIRFPAVYGIPPEDIGLAVFVEITDAYDLPVLIGLVGTFAVLEVVSPFMNQTRFLPFTVFLQRMSGLPSLLKSPLPTICQF